MIAASIKINLSDCVEKKKYFTHMMTIGFVSFYLSEFVGITICTSVLTYFLFKKREIMHRGKSSKNFKKSICTLFAIVLTFGFSYFIRVLTDLVTDNNYDGSRNFR